MGLHGLWIPDEQTLNMLIDLDTLRPLGAKILVKRYTKPETVKGLIIPENYREDDTLSLWEVVGPRGPRADSVVGTTLHPETLLKTPPFRGVHIGENADGIDLYVIEAGEVQNVIQW